MTSMAPNPITGEYGPDPMLGGMTGEDFFNRRMGITGLPGGGQNPYEQILNPQILTQNPFGGEPRQLPPAGWNPQQPTQNPSTQNPWQQPPQQNPLGMGLGALANIQQMTGQMTGFGEQMGGFGETLGGYKDLLGGYGEQLGGFGEQLGGFKDEFSGINDKLQNLEQGISSLTDKFGTQQQQSPYQQNFGMNPFGSFNSYNPYFGGLGMFMRPY